VKKKTLLVHQGARMLSAFFGKKTNFIR